MSTAHPNHITYRQPLASNIRPPYNQSQSHLSRGGYVNTSQMHPGYNNYQNFNHNQMHHTQHYHNDPNLYPNPQQYQRPYHPHAHHHLNQNPNYNYNLPYDPRHMHHHHHTQNQYLNPNLPPQYNRQNLPYQGQYDPRHVQKSGIPKPIIDPKAPVVRQVIYQQQPLNIPQPVRNVQYVPQLHRYMDYVEQRIKVPVEKYYTDYYQIEHITDFVPRQYQDTVIQMVPEQIIRYRLEYVPVQRKIVHLPKSDVYDQNGLYKGIGNLADRATREVTIDRAAVDIINQQQKKAQGAINKALYQNLSNSQIQRSAMRGLQQSLVNGISRNIQNPRGNLDQSTNLINQNLYANLGGMVSGSNQNLASQQQYGKTSQSQLNETIYKNILNPLQNRSRLNTDLPQNQMYNQQVYGALSRNLNKSRIGASRRRTNYVTSDGYFPNYEDQLKNIQSYNPPREYFNQSYAANTASRMQGSKAAYNLGQNLLSAGGYSSSNPNRMTQDYDYY